LVFGAQQVVFTELAARALLQLDAPDLLVERPHACLVGSRIRFAQLLVQRVEPIVVGVVRAVAVRGGLGHAQGLGHSPTHAGIVRGRLLHPADQLAGTCGLRGDRGRDEVGRGFGTQQHGVELRRQEAAQPVEDVVVGHASLVLWGLVSRRSVHDSSACCRCFPEVGMLSPRLFRRAGRLRV
jgi:hypothetical protein